MIHVTSVSHVIHLGKSLLVSICIGTHIHAHIYLKLKIIYTVRLYKVWFIAAQIQKSFI